MIKPGIWRLDQFRRPFWFGSRRAVSYRLLRLCRQQKSEEAVRLFEEIVFDLHLSSGICRTTFGGRFQALDGLVLDLLRPLFPAALPLAVQDWAASDCLASAEWASSLLPVYPALSFTASDLTLAFAEVTMPDGPVLVLEPGGQPLQYEEPPYVISFLHRDSPVFFLNRLARGRALAAARKAAAVVTPAMLEQAAGGQTVEAGGFRLDSIPLVHPGFQALAAADPRVALRRHSVFEPLPEPCHVIRTMNIFNRSYFDDARLTAGFDAVLGSLADGGVWIAGSTVMETRTNRATVYRKSGSALIPLLATGGGFPAADLLSGRLA